MTPGSLATQIRSRARPQRLCAVNPITQLCADLADTNDSGKTQKTLSTVGGVGFAAFGAATVAILVPVAGLDREVGDTADAMGANDCERPAWRHG